MNLAKFIFIILLTTLTEIFPLDEIIWLKTNLPPYMILTGSKKDCGLIDKAMKLYQQNLPGYKHNNLEMNWSRFWHDIKNKEKICNVMALKTKERDLYSVHQGFRNFTSAQINY